MKSEHYQSVKNYGIAYRAPKSISSFVACFKSVVTVNALKINSCFGWQSRFYDNIVQNDQENPLPSSARHARIPSRDFHHFPTIYQPLKGSFND
jgi:hypothetical protein